MSGGSGGHAACGITSTARPLDEARVKNVLLIMGVLCSVVLYTCSGGGLVHRWGGVSVVVWSVV